jgi:ferredoxin-NADP reductase
LTDFSKQADVYAYCKEAFPDLAGWRIYLCGADSFVRKMRKHSFLAGAKMADISADSFIAAS